METKTTINLDETDYTRVMAGLTDLRKKINTAQNDNFFSVPIHQAMQNEIDEISKLIFNLQQEHYKQNEAKMKEKIMTTAEQIKKNQKKAK